MSDLTELAEAWADYVERAAEGTAEYERILYLIGAGGGSEAVFILQDSTARLSNQSRESRVKETELRGNAGRCLLLLKSAAQANASGWSFLMPEAIRSIRATLTDAGLNAPDLGLWEVFTSSDTADVRPHEKKG